MDSGEKQADEDLGKALQETGLPEEKEEKVKVDPESRSKDLKHHDIEPERSPNPTITLPPSKEISGNLEIKEAPQVLGVPDLQDFSTMTETQRNQAFVPYTLAQLDMSTRLNIATNIVEDFFVRDDLKGLMNKQGEHRDARLGRDQSKEPCEIWIGNGNKSTPPDRIFSILAPDTQDMNYIAAKKGTKKVKDFRMVVVCFDVLDLLVAEEENKKKISPQDEKYNLIPNIAVESKYKVDPHILKQYALTFAYFSKKDSEIIRIHSKNFVEVESARQSIERNVAFSFVKDILTPIFSYLFQTVGGLFEAIFGDGFIARLGKTIGKTIGKIYSYVSSAVSYIASGVKKVIQVSPTVSWVIRKIYSSAKFLTKFIWNNPMFLNCAIFIIKAIQIILCVWWQGPKVGIETLSSWLETQWAWKTGKHTWTALVTLAKAIAQCGSVWLGGSLMDCITAAGTSFGKTLFNFTDVVVDGIATATGLKFVAGAIKDSFNMLIGKEIEALRGEAMAYLSLDWEMFKKALPILLPRLLMVITNFLPLPAFLINWTQKGMNLINRGVAYYTFYHNYVHLLVEVFIVFWNCYRGSGDCCYPQSYKDRYAEAIRRKEAGETKDFEERVGDTFSMLGRRISGAIGSLISDERVKYEIMTTDLIVDHLSIKLYSLRPDFLHQLGLAKGKKLPKWIRDMQCDRGFWEHQLFFSVSAQELERHYPLAVKQYCFTKSQCVRYILLSALPPNLRRTLFRLNHDLSQERLSICYNCLKYPEPSLANTGTRRA
jgi:hypothetical protein